MEKKLGKEVGKEMRMEVGKEVRMEVGMNLDKFTWLIV